MTPYETRCYLRNVIDSGLIDEIPCDETRINTANKIEESVTRLFAVKSCDIGGMYPKPENMLMSYAEMTKKYETNNNNDEGVF